MLKGNTPGKACWLSKQKTIGFGANKTLCFTDLRVTDLDIKTCV